MFAECHGENFESNVEKKIDDVSLQYFKSKTIFPLAKGKRIQVSKSSITGESSKVNELNKEKLDPNAYRLLAKSVYDFENPTPMGKFIDDKSYGLNDTQNNFLEYGDRFQETKMSIRFKRPIRVKISIWNKVNTSFEHYITT